MSRATQQLPRVLDLGSTFYTRTQRGDARNPIISCNFSFSDIPLRLRRRGYKCDCVGKVLDDIALNQEIAVTGGQTNFKYFHWNIFCTSSENFRSEIWVAWRLVVIWILARRLKIMTIETYMNCINFCLTEYRRRSGERGISHEARVSKYFLKVKLLLSQVKKRQILRAESAEWEEMLRNYN